jgi:hypothetical protein
VLLWQVSHAQRNKAWLSCLTTLGFVGTGVHLLGYLIGSAVATSFFFTGG